MMGTIWKSQKTPAFLMITLLQIQALMTDEVQILNGVEGQRLDIRCDYPYSQRENPKYFCYGDCSPSSHLIRTDKHQVWVRGDRFSLYDNTTGAFMVARVDELRLGDGGMYYCGVDISLYRDTLVEIQLSVSPVRITTNPLENVTQNAAHGGDIKMDTFHLPLVLTAVMCVAALLFVCIFTLFLLLVVKQQTSASRPNREISSDYETMMPGVPAVETTDSHSHAYCIDLPALEPPPDICLHFTSRHRYSSVTPGFNAYVDVEELEQDHQYQHLDPSLLEEHIYHSLCQSNNPKDQPVGDKD
ncbi:CMRF35-like molecule 1 isoform X2 [Genypterus blacodes]|uniref:CMRF35-like molecule 1 isoform X2 n=1 Tax=Genypterus blacodes TaxID=154954 RepID=UPI003F762994